MFGLFGQIRRGSPRRAPTQRADGNREKNAVPPVRVKTQETLTLSGRKIQYTLVSSRLARGVRIKISPNNGLEIVVPRRFSLSALPHLLHEKENWIIKHLSKLETQNKSSANRLRDGELLHLFGEPYTLRFLPTIKRVVSVKEARALKFVADRAEETGKEILVYSRAFNQGADYAFTASASMPGATAYADSPGGAAPDALKEPGALPEPIKKEFEVFFRKKAKQYFSKRVPEIAQIMGVNFARITVRGQQSRWGSCSRENNLNFNWRLAFYEKQIADYVIFHELAHTVHHNHSTRFYALLERFCPDYKALRKTLREGHAPI